MLKRKKKTSEDRGEKVRKREGYTELVGSRGREIGGGRGGRSPKETGKTVDVGGGEGYATDRVI